MKTEKHHVNITGDKSRDKIKTRAERGVSWTGTGRHGNMSASERLKEAVGIEASILLRYVLSARITSGTLS